MAVRNPQRPLPGALAGLGENLNSNMGVTSSRGKAPTGASMPDPNNINILGLPESLVTPDEPIVSRIDLRKKIAALQLPGFDTANLEKIVDLMEVVGVGIVQKALAHYSVYSQIKPFDNYDIYNIPIVAGAQAVRLDRIGDDFRKRRALCIFNPSAVDVLWVGKTDRTNAVTNMGVPVAVNNGSYMVAAHERLPHFGFCVGANTAIVAQYA